MYRLRLRSFNNPRTNQAATKIQRWFRFRRRLIQTRRAKVAKPLNAKEQALATVKRWLQRTIRMRPVNQVDPITLEPPTPPVFKHFNTTGKLNAFDAQNLAAYFRATGNFVHPVTREPFTRVDVLRLQNLLPPSERTLLEQMPNLAAQRDASLLDEAEIRVAETATQMLLEHINELSMLPHASQTRQLRSLYTVFIPDLLMVISSVGQAFGDEVARRIVQTSLTWIDTQQAVNLIALNHPQNGFDAARANRMVVILETTRLEMIRMSSDLGMMQRVYEAMTVAAQTRDADITTVPIEMILTTLLI